VRELCFTKSARICAHESHVFNVDIQCSLLEGHALFAPMYQCCLRICMCWLLDLHLCEPSITDLPVSSETTPVLAKLG
jgi:hypothetical protein